MGIVDSFISGVKNSLQWKAQSAVVGGVDTGIKTVTKLFNKNKCPKCGKSLPEEGAAFCVNCGANMVLTCPNANCGRQSPLGTKFCPGCGSNLQTKKSAT